MKFNPFEIKGERQTNGLWGMPVNVRTLKLSGVMSDENNYKFSAIINGIVQIHGNECKLGIEQLGGTDYIKIDVINSSLWKTDSKIFLNIDEYGIIDNKLYYIKSEEDKRNFYRTAKLKNINER